MFVKNPFTKQIVFFFYYRVSRFLSQVPKTQNYFFSRVLLAKEKDSERWKRELEAMETHTESRKLRPTWGADQVNIADFLIDHCKLGNKFDKDLVQRVCGILEVSRIRAN